MLQHDWYTYRFDGPVKNGMATLTIERGNDPSNPGPYVVERKRGPVKVLSKYLWDTYPHIHNARAHMYDRLEECRTCYDAMNPTREQGE